MLSSLLHAQDGVSVDHDPSTTTPLEPPPSAASPTDQGPGYRIGRDDVLAVSVLHAPELTVTVRVTEHGDISLPLLGAVPAAGLTALELETALETRLRDRYIREPDVTVQVTELQSQPISVVGAVKRPGTFQIRGARTLLEVLSLAEGVADHAGDSVVVLRNASTPSGHSGDGTPIPASASTQLSFEVPLKALLSSSDPRANVTIHPGDVVNVRAAEIVYVVGAVRKPGAFAVRGHEPLTVLRAVALGEGLLPTAADGDALVLRTGKSGERVEIAVNLGDVLKGRQRDFALEAQDVLFVPTSGSKAVARAALEALTRIVTFRGVL